MFRLTSRTDSDRKQRHAWEDSLHWFRWRYTRSQQSEGVLGLLSINKFCRRIAIRYLHDAELPQLYLGIPADYLERFERVRRHFQLHAQGAAVETVALSAELQPLRPTATFDWQRSFVAHLVDAHLFISVEREAEADDASFWPTIQQRQAQIEWTLPKPVPAGLAAHSVWDAYSVPEAWCASKPDGDRWLLGRTFTETADRAIYAPTQKLNLYGRHLSLAQWLVPQLVQTIRHDVGRLIVIDAVGNLVPQLKRKQAVTQHLGEQLTYLDLQQDALGGGLNPLAALPDEVPEAQLARWQAWFRDMNVHPDSLPLLAEAQAAGVSDLTKLQTWLRSQERRGQIAAVSSLRLLLGRLLAHPKLREWLEWPTNPYVHLPDGALLVACPAADWEHTQLLNALLLAATAQPECRLVLHGLPWQALPFEHVKTHPQVAVSNGPLLDAATIILTASHPDGQTRLADRFLPTVPQLNENLALLQAEEGMLLYDDVVCQSLWKKPIPLEAYGEA